MHAPPAATTVAVMRSSSVLLAVAVALLALGAARTLLGSGEPTPVTEHPVTVPEKPRTVTVSMTMPAPSAHERRLSAMLEQGSMPIPSSGPSSVESNQHSLQRRFNGGVVAVQIDRDERHLRAAGLFCIRVGGDFVRCRIVHELAVLNPGDAGVHLRNQSGPGRRGGELATHLQ